MTEQNLTDNFSYSEMVKSSVAERFGILNVPDEHEIERFKNLCLNVLEPVRAHYALPVTITSGYRSKELCIQLGSSINSQHIKGEAADIRIKGIDNKELADYIYKNLDFDQLILEFYNKDDSNSSWCHVSYNKGNNRNQYLHTSKSKGCVLYTLVGSINEKSNIPS